MTDVLEKVAPKNDEDRNLADDLTSANTAYFYYLNYPQPNSNHHTITAYEYFDIRRPLGDVEDVVNRLVRNTLGNDDDPRPYANNFDDLLRRRKGYFLIAVEGRKFLDDKPITFYGQDAAGDETDGTHTFTFLGVITLQEGTRTFSVAAYMNHMKRWQNEADLKVHEWEHYFLSYNFEGEAETLRLQIDDSGGTNMGPPPPPPLLPAGFLRS